MYRFSITLSVLILLAPPALVATAGAAGPVPSTLAKNKDGKIVAALKSGAEVVLPEGISPAPSPGLYAMAKPFIGISISETERTEKCDKEFKAYKKRITKKIESQGELKLQKIEGEFKVSKVNKRKTLTYAAWFRNKYEVFKDRNAPFHPVAVGVMCTKKSMVNITIFQKDGDALTDEVKEIHSTLLSSI